VRYVSTRGDGTQRAFCEILLEGLAPDGGLYMPVAYPQVDEPTLQRWRALPYADLAFEILSLYIDDVPAEDLHTICRRVYSKQVFGTDAIVPLKPLGGGVSLVALSNGPTLAFKDMAMQLLGALFEYELARRGQTLNILGATSGDTGSAAEHAMRGKRGIRVFMLSPQGRMSPFQQAQMFSLQDENIHNLAVEGVFDDCQDIVKAVGNDLAFKRAHRIGTVNSINWARLVAQVVYYFAAYLQSKPFDTPSGVPCPEPVEGSGRTVAAVDFAVPSGNFGNICAGHVARRMGLPIGRLVCATNENDVLDEFFRSGTYRPRAGSETHETSSPSMDISKASNFERFVFDLLGRDGARVRQLFAQPQFTLTSDEHARIDAFGFVSGRSTHADRVATIRDTWQRAHTMIDPHTADGLKVAREQQRAGVPMLVLETALPAKFAATIREALGREPERPPGFEGIEQLPKRFAVVPAEAAAVKRYIEAHV
jgi:threonine synthase